MMKSNGDPIKAHGNFSINPLKVVSDSFDWWFPTLVPGVVIIVAHSYH